MEQPLASPGLPINLDMFQPVSELACQLDDINVNWNHLKIKDPDIKEVGKIVSNLCLA